MNFVQLDLPVHHLHWLLEHLDVLSLAFLSCLLSRDSYFRKPGKEVVVVDECCLLDDNIMEVQWNQGASRRILTDWKRVPHMCDLLTLATPNPFPVATGYPTLSLTCFVPNLLAWLHPGLTALHITSLVHRTYDVSFADLLDRLRLHRFRGPLSLAPLMFVQGHRFAHLMQTHLDSHPAPSGETRVRVDFRFTLSCKDEVDEVLAQMTALRVDARVRGSFDFRCTTHALFLYLAEAVPMALHLRLGQRCKAPLVNIHCFPFSHTVTLELGTFLRQPLIPRAAPKFFRIY